MVEGRGISLGGWHGFRHAAPDKDCGAGDHPKAPSRTWGQQKVNLSVWGRTHSRARCDSTIWANRECARRKRL